MWALIVYNKIHGDVLYVQSAVYPCLLLYTKYVKRAKITRTLGQKTWVHTQGGKIFHNNFRRLKILNENLKISKQKINNYYIDFIFEYTILFPFALSALKIMYT